MERFRLTILVESRIRWKVYVRFGGEYWETYHRNMTRRRVLSLHFHVPLGCGYTLVSHHALYGADVRSGSRLQRSECSTIGVECDLLGDSSRTNPPFHVSLGPAAL